MQSSQKNNQNELADQYLALLKKTLTDNIRERNEDFISIQNIHLGKKSKLLLPFDKVLRKRGYAICKLNKTNSRIINEGKGWPLYAETMIGEKRLNNIEFCVRDILKNNIPGDLIETGVWRGGATIFMKAILKIYGDETRKVWVADSFQGLPKPNKDLYKEDAHDQHFMYNELAIDLEQVKNNFKKYNLLDERVKFLKGWFKDTLPHAKIKKLAVIRLDGDMYESTMDGLNNLYHKLSKGGYLIVDDYGAVRGCKKAVHDFRKKHNITEEIIKIDWTGIYWKKLF